MGGSLGNPGSIAMLKSTKRFFGMQPPVPDVNTKIRKNFRIQYMGKGNISRRKATGTQAFCNRTGFGARSRPGSKPFHTRALGPIRLQSAAKRTGNNYPEKFLAFGENWCIISVFNTVPGISESEGRFLSEGPILYQQHPPVKVLNKIYERRMLFHGQWHR